MAKMFYSMEETKAALGRNEEGVNQLAREGRLRQFLDGQKRMFKADQVEALKAELAGAGSEISLAPAEPEIPPAGDSAGGLPLADASHHSAPGTDDDFLNLVGGSSAGASGLTGLGSPGASSAGGTAAGTRGGVTIFDVDDSQRVDPSAQTAINASPDQLASMESIGSGSGLLDLTRESEDTSLGAVFDELPGGKSGAGFGASRSGPGFDAKPESAPEKPRPIPTMAPPTYIDAPDPIGAGLGIASLGALLCVGFALCVLGAALLGYQPEFLEFFAQSFMNLMYLVGGGLVLSLILFVAGYFVANAGRK